MGSKNPLWSQSIISRINQFLIKKNKKKSDFFKKIVPPREIFSINLLNYHTRQINDGISFDGTDSVWNPVNKRRCLQTLTSICSVSSAADRYPVCKCLQTFINILPVRRIRDFCGSLWSLMCWLQERPSLGYNSTFYTTVEVLKKGERNGTYWK